ncbi:TrkH family potassium uptake protein [Larsenimonas rhizosphaerae]|uniref:TrkH family potassium uptake protein n=1 Tax=Larsenimonas rhizosphaerae TaxID=2944682 RepID=A0AA41ZFN7_9GAMM|nr:TrkH family potassium uptake protein [Larsenimonas rhizosphaerae]MCM2130600.1 TrkH family potassium uptake protein [Larsenimonas rhizosphaerae]MCX2523304.1 TrkH family potassium uptake protein [Larsenimonas rhizosphaerae]
MPLPHPLQHSKRSHLFRHRALQLNPPLMLLTGFTVLAILGTLALQLPGSTTISITWMEALFTATSAITVTGLGVMDVGQHLTTWGQVILLILIQLGGLGFMTFAALTMVFLGARLPIQQQNVVRESLNQSSYSDLLQLVRLVIVFALVVELLTTLLLAIAWVPDLGWHKGLWYSVFHAISAFNNAGFSLWSDSLVHYAGSPLVTLTITASFIIGGLGFAVVQELLKHRRHTPWSMQTRLVILTTVGLNVVGTLMFALLEWHNPHTLGGMPSLSDKWLAAWFQAVTPRTAGFNTIDTGDLTTPSSLLTMLYMFIGGGPGSTASGIKVTTFVVLLLTARAFLRGSTEPVIFSRRISSEIVFKAVAVALSAMILVFTVLFGLSITEPGKPFLDLAFETVSAFGTVGLSRGVTPHLSGEGQLLLVLTMLLGRVGSLSLGYFLATRQTPGLRYAKGRIQIG